MRQFVFLIFALSGCCIKLVQSQTKWKASIYCPTDRPEPFPKSSCLSRYCYHRNHCSDDKCKQNWCSSGNGTWVDGDCTCCEGGCGTKSVTCLHNGVEYEQGEKFQSEETCELCSCDGDENSAEMNCTPLECQCIGTVVPDHTCCGRCQPPPCSHESGLYSYGVKVPSNNPCEDCECVGDGVTESRVVCTTKVCHPCPAGRKRKNDGTCCGQCVLDDQCDCPAVSCPKRLKYQAEGDCCPQCKCKYRGKMVAPGPVGKKCSGCVCSNGTVTCTRPTCPEKLECVDAVRGDDCCYHCPNGPTCLYAKGKKRKVLKTEKVHFVYGMVCMCAGSPWWPEAICVREIVPKVLSRSMRKYKNQLADYEDAFRIYKNADN